MLKRFGVVFEYSMAWLLPIAGLSFVIAWLKFRKLSKLPDISKGMALLISGLRFIVIFTLLALLLNPAFSWVEKTKEETFAGLGSGQFCFSDKNEGFFVLSE